MKALRLLLCLFLTAFQDLCAQSCGGQITNRRGDLSSPRYPNNYPDNSRCTWTIHSTERMKVSLTFNSVSLETCCDYIKVYDGPSTSHPLLGEIREYRSQSFKSSNNDLTVYFYSDSSSTSKGFHANWVFVDSNSCRNNCGYSRGSCSCDYSCRYYSNCCSDYSYYCSSTTISPRPAKEHVNCSSDNMTIVIQRSYLNSLGLNGSDLYVNDHLCRPTISSSEVMFSFPLNACGTVKEMMNSNVSYYNNVRASQSRSGQITRQSQFLLRVGCRMEPDTMVQIFYKARENINANITGTGHFGANIAFYSSSNFDRKIYDSPFEVNLNQLLYIQVALNRPDNSLDLFLDTCVASPNPNDFKDRSYDLLRNGCPRDNTYYSYTSGQHYYARFNFQAFKFLQTHAYVYLQCKVIICPDNYYNSRCRQGCHFRRKRSLDSTYHTNTVTLGPIKLKGA
ncbi:deleted in malignant brain tumors 1 protein-like isoform X2 [Carassius carassius]|uniref:deleted in malignant brain tumors 1 protein-like isoform X2 n=1 Tax=Carassius carassius TaxID=217509 RepID=UPI0028694EBD|nr:deleted in malignant brain tumors 1 protein-like isoform X2 [Carassius carassius]